MYVLLLLSVAYIPRLRLAQFGFSKIKLSRKSIDDNIINLGLGCFLNYINVVFQEFTSYFNLEFLGHL